MRRFGIFLPVRNGARFIKAAVDSIIAQSNEDWELFILDNASTDGTVELLQSYQHPRVHIHKSALALSIWESWHRVWQLMTEGAVKVEFATIIGHDDILLPDFLDSISRLITAHPNASLYQTSFDLIDQNGDLIRPCRPIPGHESSEDFLAARLWGLRDSFGTGYVFRSLDYIKVGGIPNLPSLLYADDLLFARLSRFAYKAAASDSKCLYRLHRMSTSNQVTAVKIKNQIEALVEYIKYLEDEFPEFLKSKPGKNALASLLAREIMIYSPLEKKWLMGNVTVKYLLRLKILYYEVSEIENYRQWLEKNFAHRIFYVYLKRIMLIYVLLKDKFFI
jgi:glycosyltransferase involved in cell wall biosynthesis